MKKLLITATALTALSLGGALAYAQGWGPGHHGYGYHHGYYNGYGYHHIEFLKDELNLSEKQVEAIIKINSDFRVKFFKNRDDAKKIEVLRAEQKKAVENVLTAEQKKKYTDLETNWRGRGGYGCGLCSY
ncbi:MAG TPA: hypothetical protein PK926_06655 [Spirochaetota bacterium]|nr:hypothetical protein [Spirochaetota bacterium]HPI89590.1 hypothetical protein [Spirochaetota bacterium]HPR48049.1 hypothetical protein [Spirochaetota bacterium]